MKPVGISTQEEEGSCSERNITMMSWKPSRGTHFSPRAPSIPLLENAPLFSFPMRFSTGTLTSSKLMYVVPEAQTPEHSIFLVLMPGESFSKTIRLFYRGVFSRVMYEMIVHHGTHEMPPMPLPPVRTAVVKSTHV
jgi:hypothetical protein